MENATFPGVPAPSPELRRLAPLVGRWRCETMTLPSVLGPGVRATAEETIEWLDGGYFLMQAYRMTFDGEAAQTGVNYWFFDEASGRFRIIFFSNNGPFTEDGNRYEGTVEGSTLTFVGPARFQYDLDDAGIIRVDGAGGITSRWWLRDERGDFQPWMTNTFRAE